MIIRKIFSIEWHSDKMYILSVIALFHNFSFWGVVSFIPLYLVGEYQYTEGEATQAYGFFLGATMALPLLGGYAVFFLRRCSIPIVLGSFLLTLGCVLMGLKSKALLSISLVSIALGYGIFWPSVMTLLGKIYDRKDSTCDTGFTMFYAISTVGIFMTQMLGSFIVGSYGWAWLYFVLAAAGFVGTAVFLASYQVYRPIDSTAPQIISGSDNPSSNLLATTEKKRIIAIFTLALFSMVFWMGCSQMGSSVVFFSKNFVHRSFLNAEVPPTVFLSFFALSVVILGPVMAAFWSFLRQRDIQLSTPKQMATSLAFLALSFLVISIAGTEIDADEVSGHVSSLFLFIFYFLQASAVIIMGPIGLAFVTKWAPSRLIGQLVGLWFFTTGMGSFIGGYAASAFADVLSPSQLFGLFFLANAIMSLGLFVMNSFIVSLLGD